MYIFNNIVKRKTNVGIKIKCIMLRECATIATISMEGLKSHGTALMISCMQLECAKIAISTTTIEKKERKSKDKEN